MINYYIALGLSSVEGKIIMDFAIHPGVYVMLPSPYTEVVRENYYKVSGEEGFQCVVASPTTSVLMTPDCI